MLLKRRRATAKTVEALNLLRKEEFLCAWD